MREKASPPAPATRSAATPTADNPAPHNPPFQEASFAEATKGLLGLKLPPEVLAHGSMSAFHRSLSRSRVATYTTQSVFDLTADFLR